MTSLFTRVRPLIHLLPPETAHHLGLCALRHGLLPSCLKMPCASLETQLWGLRFCNPIGLAAGFDKNAVAVDGLLKQGFGFVECGTVTPLAQAGNPRPRVFRLSQDRAVINRLGFNNNGLDAFSTQFQRRNRSLGIAGVNIGKNKDAVDAVADYVAGLRGVYAFADYVTINISSPNTQGLRDLQHRQTLEQLLGALLRERETCESRYGRQVPLLLKVAPDLSAEEREDVAHVVMAHGLDGLIVSNTTLSRPAHLRSMHKTQMGGLSGMPLLSLSTLSLAHFYRLTKGALPLIGVGGIASAEDAYAKIRAGASLVQLYTALVYQGFGVVERIAEGLAALLAKDGFSKIAEAVGTDVQ